MQPDYLKKADYGKSPAYLEQVKEEIRRENEMIDAYVAEMGRQQDPAGFAEGEQLEPFSEDERRDLVRSLKRKWDATNAKYQRMCHMTKLDTVGKVKRLAKPPTPFAFVLSCALRLTERPVRISGKKPSRRS